MQTTHGFIKVLFPLSSVEVPVVCCLETVFIAHCILCVGLIYSNTTCPGLHGCLSLTVSTSNLASAGN